MGKKLFLTLNHTDGMIEPYRWNDSFWVEDIGDDIYLPKGSIKKLIGRDLTWEDEPGELKEE